MRMFRREIEVTLKTIGALTLLTLIVVPAVWGYGQRQKARTWQNIACAYRIKEVERRTPLLGAIDPGRDACLTLERMGLALELPASLADRERGPRSRGLESGHDLARQ